MNFVPRQVYNTVQDLSVWLYPAHQHLETHKAGSRAGIRAENPQPVGSLPKGTPVTYRGAWPPGTPTRRTKNQFGRLLFFELSAPIAGITEISIHEDHW